ncbi:MAG: hypothetical protein HC912_07515 [Saprospiraceae bacterium]|nr:hypothetical protein [Saprospiraceae bacterium]
MKAKFVAHDALVLDFLRRKKIYDFIGLFARYRGSLASMMHCMKIPSYKKMILIESRGQMGNQLFQYAFAYTTAKKLNTFFVIDKGDCQTSFTILLYYLK